MMILQPDSRKTGNALQAEEIRLLYQLSNTMLSTITLNKLSHLILTALVSREPLLFERGMLFLCNERSGIMQGMLGVASDRREKLKIIGEHDSLDARWDIDDETMMEQKNSDFCRAVRSSRIDSGYACPVIKQVVEQRKTAHFRKEDCLDCPTCTFLKLLGVVDFVVTPLIARDSILGIIVVDNYSNPEPDFVENSMYFMRLFANQAGMAIENSILYSKMNDARSNLKDARERLLHGERLAAIGEMAANLAHELKNPLITIGGFAGRLQKILADDTREFHYADTIVKEVARLERMLADILAFSKKPTICFTECDLNFIIEESLDSCVSAIDAHGIIIDHPVSTQKFEVLGDCYQLKQVFINLILNACDAMPNGGRLAVRLYASAADRVTTEISDTGGGIADELKSQIFTPFFTTKQHGTGLGLPIVNRIILNHNGEITVTNNGQGALFSVLLPIYERPVIGQR